MSFLSTSQNTIFAPFDIIELPTDGKLILGTIISSLEEKLNKSDAKKIASVQLEVREKMFIFCM